MAEHLTSKSGQKVLRVAALGCRLPIKDGTCIYYPHMYCYTKVRKDKLPHCGDAFEDEPASLYLKDTPEVAEQLVRLRMFGSAP